MLPGEMDETDVSQQTAWVFARRAEKAITALKRNRFDAFFAPTRHEALTMVLEMIPENSVVSFADSVTIHQIGLFEKLADRKPKEVIRPVRWDANHKSIHRGQELRDLQIKVFSSDVFICGVNAVTMDGKILSVDGLGNRVAPMIYGPKRVIIVAGANKVVTDVDAARDRIRTMCGPGNMRRHFEKHNSVRFGELPCYKTGFCANCNMPQRVCNYTVVLENQGINLIIGEEPKKVVIVGEDLGI